MPPEKPTPGFIQNMIEQSVRVGSDGTVDWPNKETSAVQAITMLAAVMRDKGGSIEPLLKTRDGNPLLAVAIAKGDTKMIDTLLEVGADPKASVRIDGQKTPLTLTEYALQRVAEDQDGSLGITARLMQTGGNLTPETKKRLNDFLAKENGPESIALADLLGKKDVPGRLSREDAQTVREDLQKYGLDVAKTERAAPVVLDQQLLAQLAHGMGGQGAAMPGKKRGAEIGIA